MRAFLLQMEEAQPPRIWEWSNFNDIYCKIHWEWQIMSSKIVGSWRTRTWLAGIFVVAATAGGARAQLTNLPDAIFTQNLSVDETGENINPYSPCGFISCTGEGSSSASNFPSSEPDHGAQASFSGFPSPTVTVSASASSRGYGVANAQSDVV